MRYLLLPLALALSACGQGPTDAELPGELEVRVDGASFSRIDNGDGTYSLAIAPGDVPVDLLVDGAVTYQYSGQARFSDDAVSLTEQRYSIGGQRASALEELYDTVRIDNLGREWAVVDVDRDLACTIAEQSPDNCDIDAVPDFEPIEEGTWYPQSWSFPFCQVAVGGDVLGVTETVWGTEDRNAVGSSFTDRQKPTVALYYAAGAAFATTDADYKCSATVIRPNFVLTAAHCVTAGGATLNPNDFQVCTRGNRHVVLGQSTCTHALSIQVNTNWLTSEDKEWDFAIVEVVADLESFVGGMNLSDALPADVEAATLHQNGYPFAEPGCNAGNIWLAGSDDTDLNGVNMFHQTGSAFNANPSVVKTQMDSGSGHSGGSLYKCPGTTCEAGEQAWLVAVWSGFYDPDIGWSWTGGPSVPGHRTWILNHL